MKDAEQRDHNPPVHVSMYLTINSSDSVFTQRSTQNWRYFLNSEVTKQALHHAYVAFRGPYVFLLISSSQALGKTSASATVVDWYHNTVTSYLSLFCNT